MKKNVLNIKRKGKNANKLPLLYRKKVLFSSSSSHTNSNVKYWSFREWTFQFLFCVPQLFKRIKFYSFSVIFEREIKHWETQFGKTSMVYIEKKPSATNFNFCYCSTISKRSIFFCWLGLCILAISFYFNPSTLRYFIAKFLFVSFKVRQIENVWVIKETAKSYFDCFAIHTLFKNSTLWQTYTHTHTQFPFDWKKNIEWNILLLIYSNIIFFSSAESMEYFQEFSRSSFALYLCSQQKLRFNLMILCIQNRPLCFIQCIKNVLMKFKNSAYFSFTHFFSSPIENKKIF